MFVNLLLLIVKNQAGERINSEMPLLKVFEK